MSNPAQPPLTFRIQCFYDYEPNPENFPEGTTVAEMLAAENADAADNMYNVLGANPSSVMTDVIVIHGE
jgi:hypothetical protein